MQEHLSLKEFGEIHDLPFETVRKYFKEGRLPDPDVVIGGGRLRGKVAGLAIADTRPGSRSDARFGWLPRTAMEWERPGQGARTDLREK